jgi:hypothetical protein
VYQLIDTRTGEVLAEFFDDKTAMSRCNALTFVFGPHYAIRPTFDNSSIYDRPLPGTREEPNG